MGTSLSIEEHLQYEQMRWKYYQEKENLYFKYGHLPDIERTEIVNRQLNQMFIWKNGRPFDYRIKIADHF